MHGQDLQNRKPEMTREERNLLFIFYSAVAMGCWPFSTAYYATGGKITADDHTA
jgi:hypothetical protein